MGVQKPKALNKKKAKIHSVEKPRKQKAHVMRALKDKEPKLVENVKKLLLIRGNRTNQVMNQLLTDMVRPRFNLQESGLEWHDHW